MDVDEMKDWLVNEMFYPGTLPNNDQLEDLCTGAMKDVWKHLIRHCKSEDKARTIRSNILIAERKQNSWKTSLSITTSQMSGVDDGGERDDLLAERSRLTSQLHAVVNKIERIKKDIRACEDYKTNTLQTKDANEDEIRKLRQSFALLNLYRKQVNNVKSKIDNLTEKLSECCELAKEKEMLVKAENNMGGDMGIETQVDRKIKLALERTSNHMQTALMGSNSNARRQVREELQTILTNIPGGSSLQNSIIKIIQHQIDKVEDQLNNFDMKSEAEKLKKETEMSQSGALLSFVRDDVYEVTNKFLSSHKELVAAKKIEKERENDLEQLYSENLENILDHNELRQSLKKSYENGVEEERRNEIVKLENLLEELELAREDQDQIVTWTRNAEVHVQEMLNLISMLIESKSSGYKKLSLRKSATEELVKGLPKTCSSLLSCLDKSFNEPEEMMKTFIQIPVTRYSSTAVQNKTGFTLVPSQDLAIHRLRSTMQYPGKGSLKSDEFGLTNSINSVPDLSYKVFNLMAVIDDLKHQEQVCETQPEEKRILESVKQLPISVHASKHQQEKDFLPLISSTAKNCDEGLELCKKVESALTVHHNQLTQEVVGKDAELQVEGRTLSQWHEALRVAILNT